MLLGEHAVLAGKQALVAALLPRIEVRLLPRTDTAVTVTSQLGSAHTCIKQFCLPNSLRFVCAAIKPHLHCLSTGFDLQIHSPLSHKQGLGSSAAVTVATLAAIRHWLRLPTHTTCMLQEAVAAVRQAQNGLGSGADVAASIVGGLLAFRCLPCPNIVQQFAQTPPILLFYCGYKTPTPQVIDHVQQQHRHNMAAYAKICNAMDRLVTQALPICAQQKWRQLGPLLNQGHTLLAQLGVSTPLLNSMANTLHTTPNIWGAKISGAGLGDCVVAVGSSQKRDWPWQQLDTHITAQGFHVQYNTEPSAPPCA